MSTYKILPSSYDLSNGCDDAPTEPRYPDHILYNKVPKCGSTTLQNILEKVAESTDMTVTNQWIYHGYKITQQEQVVYTAGLGSSTADQVLKYTKYPKYIPSTSTGQVLIF